MLEERFSYEGLLSTADRKLLLENLAAELTRRLRAASDPASEGHVLVEELRRLGHDLWSFDESDDFQIWCGDWVSRKQPYELILEFRYEDETEPFATAAFRQRIKAEGV